MPFEMQKTFHSLLFIILACKVTKSAQSGICDYEQQRSSYVNDKDAENKVEMAIIDHMNEKHHFKKPL
jgi:hypothetical protein